MDANLRDYLQQNHDQLTWKERFQIVIDIIVSLESIHNENIIHKNLHSGNILYKQINQRFGISDLGFCVPDSNKSSKNIYGNLPYIAPEVIAGREYTFKSDIYSIAMLMWEISSGQPPFINNEHDYDLTINIINGIRPRIVSGTPPEYISLMKQCWDAHPLKRPDIKTLYSKIKEIYKLYQDDQKLSNELLETNNFLEVYKANSLEINYTSKFHRFENFPVPRNAIDEEQEVFHSKSAKGVSIKIGNIFKVRKITKIFKRQQTKNDSQPQVYYIDKDEIDEIYNPGLYLKVQDQF
ncbi:kinase-like domain-containing protein [Glomus cerebriforme]|uniref:Kinase-like domain-containing protein n=1 Tax=Glomus cerebriforme TaxID=658196 RepID=A0A397TEK1_9GLOM|nr:kinase-like domain-containing protein [Glomus cerebriforme]